MTRAIIGGVVAVVIATLTAVAYFVTTSKLEARIIKEVESRVLNAQDLLRQNASLEGLGLLKRVEVIARHEEFLEALTATGAGNRESIANAAFRRFLAAVDEGESRPDFLALADRNGDLVALLDVARPAPDFWKDKSGTLLYPAVDLALKGRQSTSDVWFYRQLKLLMKVGVAPIIDDVDEVAGALVIAYSLTTKEARLQHGLLGLDVAYFHGNAVQATSFIDAVGKEDVRKKGTLDKTLVDADIVKSALSNGVADAVVEVPLGDERYLATAGRLERFSSKPLPEGYPPPAGAAVLMSLTEALSPIDTVRLTILLLGVGALLVALLSIPMTARSILQPLDEIEVGINEIINGNIDRTFRPAGSDLDGLANSLNVMLARLLGRPEPGEEEYDDEGNVIGGSGGTTLAFDTEGLSPDDAAALNLAAEAEPDYYKRIFAEYIDARGKAGDTVDNINYEGFVAKLRLTEASLKKQYGSRAVRFKVVLKDGKVTLKPVPIQ
jgi:hypothetical protein